MKKLLQVRKPYEWGQVFSQKYLVSPSWRETYGCNKWEKVLLIDHIY